jgi:para-aminobenzoate synthetase/4-amino-4-deoxychorismate lyase
MKLLIQYSDHWLLFEKPENVLVCERADDVPGLLEDLDHAVQNGFWIGGYLAYEAGVSMVETEERMVDTKPLAYPCAVFGVFGEPQRLRELPPAKNTCVVGTWQPDITETQYRSALARIKSYLAAGDTYQVNFTFRLNAEFSGAPYTLFHRLCGRQLAAHCAYMEWGPWAICSASPELFLERSGTDLRSRPMKGTACRGRSWSEDCACETGLKASEKNRAENVMIVDMVRNDLGRVAEPSSINVSELCTIERYPTVLQMVSEVRARSSASLSELLKATFPYASITGAPKIRTMQIISELEQSPRGVYTGTVGFMGPDQCGTFNVAIRTAVVDQSCGTVQYGVGGGIVWDSDPEQEWEECMSKARILDTPWPEFRLLETILWAPETGFWLWDLHAERLAGSSRYFGFVFEEDKLHVELEAAVAGCREPRRVRLLVARDGTHDIQATELAALPVPYRIALAATAIASENVFLHHKTTCRTAYETARAAVEGGDDVLLYNERGEVTETTIANVALEREGVLVTPPLSCGLLAGTCRELLLKQGRMIEATITVESLSSVRHIWLMNSVRGLWQAELIQPADEAFFRVAGA